MTAIEEIVALFNTIAYRPDGGSIACACMFARDTVEILRKNGLLHDPFDGKGRDDIGEELDPDTIAINATLEAQMHREELMHD